MVHTETGGESGTIAEFLNSSSQLSTHYAVGLDGGLDCFVDPGDRAWGNAVLYAAWESKLRYPRTLRYLARHTDISPQSRANCPGDRWLASGRFQRLADTLGLKTLST